MGKFAKIGCAVALSASLAVALPGSAFACTGIYIGSQYDTDSSSYFSRCEDYTYVPPSAVHLKVFGVQAATKNSGQTYNNAEEMGGVDQTHFSRPYPASTYRFSYIRDSSDYGAGDMAYAEAGTNELGVSMSATVTTDYNDAAKAADPLTDSGVTENNIGTILLGEATSAKHAMQIAGDVMDQYGAGENFRIFASDSTGETWVFNALSGHQWVAFKLPNDKFSVDPNMGRLQYKINLDSSDVLHSEKVKQLAEDNGFAKTFADGSFDVSTSYGKANSGAGQYSRFYMGVNQLDPAVAGSLQITKDANGKLTDIQDPQYLYSSSTLKMTGPSKLMDALRTRGQGSEFDATTNSNLYPLSNPYQLECHIFQTRAGDLPVGMKTIQWQATGRNGYNVFLPSYSALLLPDGDDGFKGTVQHDIGALAQDTGNQTTPSINKLNSLDGVENSQYYTMLELNNLVDTKPDLYAKNVSKYLQNLQNKLIDEQSAVDQKMLALPADAREAKATDVADKLQTQLTQKTIRLIKEMKAYEQAGDTSKPFMPSELNADGTNNAYLDYLSLFEEPAPNPEPTPGWAQDDNGQWSYTNADGSKAVAWQEVNGTWYYFNDEGIMQTGWVQLDGAWYYLQSWGGMALDWQLVDDTWYHFDSAGAMQTGWLQLSGAWYYLTDSGAMATGWIQVDGTWYYFANDGAMQTGWVYVDNDWYYLNADGSMATGWLQLDSTWYYFKTWGGMAAGNYPVDNVMQRFASSGAWIG